MKKIIILFCIIIYSCATEQPKCEGTDVKKVLFDIVEQELMRDLESDYFNKNYNYSDISAYARDNDLDYQEVNQDMKIKIKYKAKEFAKNEISKLNIKLNATRILNINKKIKKCECASELIIDAKRHLDITYTAQYTEDNQVYVELSYY